jgi:hypothetical protein
MVVFILLSDQFSVYAAVLVRDASVIVAALIQCWAGCPSRNNQTATPSFRDRLLPGAGAEQALAIEEQSDGNAVVPRPTPARCRRRAGTTN